MLILRKTNAYIGLILAVIAISIAPMLRVPIKGNWNLYQTDTRLFFISFALLAITSFCLFIRQLRGFKIFSILLLIWSLLMAAAVYFQSNNYTKSAFANKLIGKVVHYQWGWIVLLVAVLLLVTSVRRERLITPTL
jgi:hypothetical protein